MTAIEALPTPADPPGHTLRVAGRAYPLVLPSRRDPRLHLTSVIITLQVLGQTVFHFDLSIAQILVALVTSALLDVVITFAVKKVVAWPASALLTGNGVAFVLRVPGTRHGDWWSMRGGWIFAATAAVSLLSKYVIRWHGRHVFNPSNFGLLACFLILGSHRADPLDLWWATMGPGLAVALTVIVVGGLVITRRTQMLGAAAAFWLTFAALVGVVAAAGHCMTARWHIGPVCATRFWFVLVTSPEILVFLFFMITDPKTAPAGRRARGTYGALVAVVAAFLIAPQRTEFGTKVAVLGALAVLCACRPFLERRLPADDWERSSRWRPKRVRRFVLGAVGVACVGIPLLVAAGLHARPRFSTRSAAAAAGVSRPDIHVDPAAVPPVTIRSTGKLANALSQHDAQQLGRDVIADLVITGDALRQRNPALAATAGDRAWLDDVEQQISRARRTDTVTVASYRFDQMSVAVLKLRASQAAPEIDLTVLGTIERVTYSGTRAVSTRRSTFLRIFVVEAVGGHFLIVDDRALR